MTTRSTARHAVVGIAAALALVNAGPAAAAPDVDRIRATDAFTCWDEGAAVPPNHCINTRSKGRTGVILVFAPDPRGPQEGISFDPRADDRPCPHDPDSPDGTWWQPTPAPFWVCHHKP